MIRDGLDETCILQDSFQKEMDSSICDGERSSHEKGDRETVTPD